MSDVKVTEFEMLPFFDLTPDLVCFASKEGFFKRVNHAVIEKLGYSEEELFSRPIHSFVHAEDKAQTKQTRNQMLNGNPLINFQNRYIAKNGKIVWLQWTSIYFADRNVVFAIAKDVTERKTIEREIEEKYRRFKSVATHFKASMEKDRKVLAAELHEELAQLASVVKLDIGWMKNNVLALDDIAKTKLEHALAVSDLLINAIRRISFSISSNMVDDLGLNETLHWLCKEFSILNGISCSFESAYNEPDLSNEVKLDFFRICQEALNNVMYHAHAGEVNIRIAEKSGKIILSITDNGKGFDPKQQKNTMGLTGMQERANSINGVLTMESKIGQGTKICVTVAKP